MGIFRELGADGCCPFSLRVVSRKLCEKGRWLLTLMQCVLKGWRGSLCFETGRHLPMLPYRISTRTLSLVYAHYGVLYYL